MVFGTNTLRCVKCGAVEMGTDFIDLNHMCNMCNICKERFIVETDKALKRITEMITGKEILPDTLPEKLKIKSPLQTLLVADAEMLAKILKGEKKITIRSGHRFYSLGKVVFVVDCAFDVATVAVIKQIKRVQWKILAQVTLEEIVADGFKDQHDMLNKMRKFYPEIDFGSFVTVIEWD